MLEVTLHCRGYAYPQHDPRAWALICPCTCDWTCPHDRGSPDLLVSENQPWLRANCPCDVLLQAMLQARLRGGFSARVNDTQLIHQLVAQRARRPILYGTTAQPLRHNGAVPRSTPLNLYDNVHYAHTSQLQAAPSRATPASHPRHPYIPRRRTLTTPLDACYSPSSSLRRPRDALPKAYEPGDALQRITP